MSTLNLPGTIRVNVFLSISDPAGMSFNPCRRELSLLSIYISISGSVEVKSNPCKQELALFLYIYFHIYLWIGRGEK